MAPALGGGAERTTGGFAHARIRNCDVRGRCPLACADGGRCPDAERNRHSGGAPGGRSEEHTSELQSLMRISYAVFCLKKKKTTQQHPIKINNDGRQHIKTAKITDQ